ncbi:PKD domain-containing protein [Chryseolinea lacunae]|uniref:Gliding motility-associated C-terminal domain-containing protein n=1 Tax=Chryseolinea lacunae TaxID=2801331 RepID=A0ABS1KWH6_9BACT|nr:PKD domain-containing protein [Chryseolinea lacunae]MBL0743612.1 gliding motility-associated C-terminal domain-containing protein [Chryseolinea lacunae]
MPKLLRLRFLGLFILSASLSLISVGAYSQGCQGANGTGIFPGSIANIDNGSICANLQTDAGVMVIQIKNIDETGLIQYDVDWNDGSAVQRINATKVSANTYEAQPNHMFPANGGQVKCEYNPVVKLVYNGTVCPANLGSPPRFVKWNTDDQNTGRLSLLETVTNVNEYLVCAGAETNVTFTDRSILNCVPPDLVQGQNDKQRWRQFIYGTTNTITGQVRIGGASPGFPFNGVVDASPASVINSGFPTATTQIITVPATAQVGEVFELRMNYWNTCNSFLTSRPPVFTLARIRIVDQPPAPTGNDQTVCNGTTPSSFTINGVPGGNIVNWYRNVPGSPDAPGVLITSGTSNSLNINSLPGYSNNTTAGRYIVWASYRPNVANALNCESPKIKLTRTIREAITVPNPTTAPPTEICNNNSFNIVLPNPGTTTFGGTTEYVYSGDTGVNIGSSTANSVTFNVAVSFTPGQLYVDRTVRVSRRYTTNPNCTSNRDFTVRVYNEVVGGTLSNFPDVCEGTSVGPITLSGYVGTIDHWEVEFNGGGFTTYTGPASGNSITPGVLASGPPPSTYRFKAIVKNGTCPTKESTIESVAITPNPTPPTAGTDQNFCGVFTSDPLDATGSGTWSFVGSVPIGRPAPSYSTNANDPTTQFIIGGPAQAGEYTMRWTVIIGSCTFTDDVVIDFGANPDPIPVITPIPFCGTVGKMTMPNPSIGTGLWTVTSGSPAAITIDDVNSPTSDVTLNGPGFAYGPYTLKWEVTSGQCPSVSRTVDITFFEKPIATAPDITGVCLLPGAAVTTPIPLSGTYSGGAVSGTWAVVTGNGTITSVVSGGGNVTATYNANNADYLAGTPIKVKLIAIPSGASNCSPGEDEVTITVDRRPEVNVGAATLDVCESFVQMTAEKPAPFGATGRWTTTGSVTFDDDTDPETFVRNLPAPGGSVTVTWTLTSIGGNSCTDFKNILIRRITPPAAANITANLCEVAPAGGPVTTNVLLTDYETLVTSIPAANRTIQWYQNAPPPAGVAVADPTIQLTNVLDGKIYIAVITETATGCTSNASVTVSVKPLPAAKDGIVALCENASGSNTADNIDLLGDTRYRDAITIPGNIVSWHATPGDAQNNVNPITTPIVSVIGSLDVFARITYSTGLTCPTVVKLTLQVTSIPSITEITGPVNVCMGANGQAPNTLPFQTYQVPSVPGAKYHWDIPTGAGEFILFAGGTVNDFYALIQFPYDAVHADLDIKLTVELNACSLVVPFKTVRRSAQPVAPTIAGLEMVCENESGVQYSIVGPNGSSAYTWDIYRQSDNSTGGAFIISGQATDKIFVEFTNEPVYIKVKESDNVCISPETPPYNIAVNLRPILLDNDQAVCSDSPTGIVFAEDPASPVLIDFYTITSAVYPAGVIYKVPAGPEAFPQTDLPADFLQNHVFRNPSALPLPVNYTVEPFTRTPFPSNPATFKRCVGTAQVITVNVKPEPQLPIGLKKAICSDTETAITLLSVSNTFPADRFIFTNIQIPAGVTAATPIPTVGTVPGGPLYTDNAIYNNKWINSTQGNQTVIYTIVPFSQTLNCSGAGVDIEVVIHPDVAMNPVSDAVVCSGELVNINFTATNTDAEFLWSVKNYPSDIGVSTGAGAGDIDVATNLFFTTLNTGLDQDVDMSVYAQNSALEGGSACTSTPVPFKIKVLHKTIAKSPTPIEACSDTPGGNTFTADLKAIEPSITTVPTATIAWYRTNPDTDPAAILIPPANLTAYVVTDQVPVFAQVSDGASVGSSTPGCPVVATVKFNVNPGVRLDTVKTHLTCNNILTGAIQVTVLSGTAGATGFRYSLDGAPPIATTASTFTFSSLAAKTNYFVNVEDSKGCKATITDINIKQPAPLVANLVDVKDVTCFLGNNGRIEVSATGGNAPYTFTLLETGAANSTGVFTGLVLGSYNVGVVDNKSCPQAVVHADIKQPTQVEIQDPIFVTDESCRDRKDGKLETVFSGGVGPYTLTLSKPSSPGDPAYPIIVPNVGDPVAGGTYTFLNQAGGSYRLVVTDAQGCASNPRNAFLINPPDFQAGFTGPDQAVCEGFDPAVIGELAPATGSGTTHYTYRWEFNDDNPATAASWLNLTGVTDSIYNPGVLTKTTYFRRFVTGGLCGEKMTPMTTITVNPTPKVQFGFDEPVCQGDASKTVTVSLLVGTAPMFFDYTVDYADGTSEINTSVLGNATYLIKIPSFQQDQTYTLTKLRDFNNCFADLSTVLPVKKTLQTLNTDFTIVTPDQCADKPFEFQFNAEANVSYVLNFGDGHKQIVPNTTGPAALSIPYTYPSTSVDVIKPYDVTLEGQGSCAGSTTKPVKVFPIIALNIAAGDTILCSGDDITFKDNSLGVNTVSWYYHVVGETDKFDEYTGPQKSQVTFVMTNNTLQNPLIYEVVYHAETPQGCSVDYTKQVKVYRRLTASFTHFPDPPSPLIGGISTVQFTNLTPIDADFSYTWDFGDVRAKPSGASTNPTPPAVDYTEPGPKTVRLSVFNFKSFADDNKVCQSVFVDPLTINLGTLTALFTATPLAACFPADISVKNLSEGADTFLWQLFDETGLVSTSPLSEPVFRILRPGKYSIYLTAYYHTDPSDYRTYQVKGIEIYDSPSALFQLRPNPLYVPDTEMQTFNQSLRASQYAWDFDDGETSTEFQPRHLYKLEGKYMVTLIAGYDNGNKDINGDGILDGNVICYDTAKQELVALDGGFIKLPNAFTPSPNGSSGGVPGNGTFNDVFLPITRGVEEFAMQIFDRWGNLIFESKDRNMGWDGYDRNGKLMPAGVYVFKLTLRLSDGQRTTKIGDVTLIR